MGYFPVRYDSRVVNYDRRGFIRLATGPSGVRSSRSDDCATSAAPTCQNFRFGQTSFAALCSFFACWLARHVTLAPYEKGTAEWMFEILFAKVCVFELLRLVLVPVVGDDDDVDCGCKEV